MQAIKLEIASTLESIRLAAMCINRLSQTLFNEEDSNIIELCSVEAMNNCVKHAYKNEPDHSIIIELGIQINQVTLNIIDIGNSMPPNTIEESDIDFHINPSDPDSLPEGSMGIIIIKANMDEVSYHSENGINTLTLTKKLIP